jgi:hypothetical protein
LFENELSRVLFEERAHSFLMNIYERTMTFLLERSRLQEQPEYEEPYTKLLARLSDLREFVLGKSDREPSHNQNGWEWRDRNDNGDAEAEGKFDPERA